MSRTVTIFSPVEGAAVPLEQVPDPVFSEHMLGDGLAVDPAGDTIYAPLEGDIINFSPSSHALVIRCGQAEVLIHVGLETVGLKGEGFTPLARQGDHVRQGQPLLRFDQTVLTRHNLCPFVVVLLTAPANIPVLHKAKNLLKTTDPLFEIPVPNEAEKAQGQGTFVESAPLVVINPNGLHARPAGVLAKLAMEYPYAVQLTKNGVSVNAKSVVSIMALALAYNDRVTVRAEGPQKQAQAFLTRAEAAFKAGFGEKDIVSPAKISPQSTLPNAQSGLSACPGMACGEAFLYKPADITIDECASNPKAEKKRLDDTIQTVILETELKIANEKNPEIQAILNAHLRILQDPLLLQTAREAVAKGKSAAYGLGLALRAGIGLLQRTRNTFLMERAADLKDLRRALLLRLGARVEPAPVPPPGCIWIAEDLLPSEAAALEGRAAGVLLAYGSPTAHASILLRNMNIPCIVRAGKDILDIPAGTTVCLDASHLHFTVNPTDAELETFLARQETTRREHIRNLADAQEKACTQDGIEIRVEGNISNAKEAIQAIANGADGLGLVRTEFLFHNRSQSPSEAQQQEIYQSILDAARGRPVTLRLLDAGGDKPLPFLHIPAEANPIVGIRGIRAFKNNEDFFRTQLRAMLRVRHSGNLRIMLPMVTLAEEVDFFKNLLAQEQQALVASAAVPLGIMVEVPSAALISGQLAARTDFFSIGTNDLTQYTLAIDRGHPDLAACSDHLHPSVLKLIALTCQGAAQHQKPVAVCGAMAGDLTAVPFLIGLGVRELAVGAGAVAEVKALVRLLDSQKCAALAQHALTLSSAPEVRALGRTELGK